MRMLFLAALAALLLWTGDAMCQCPNFVLNTENPGSNSTYTALMTIVFNSNNTECNCEIKDQDCSEVDGSGVFYKLNLKASKDGDYEIKGFSIWNRAILNSPMLAIGNISFIKGQNYPYDKFITSNKTQKMDLQLHILNKKSDESNVTVTMEFICVRNIASEDATFWSGAGAFALPIVTIIIIVVTVVYHFLKPDPDKMPKWAAIKEQEEDGPNFNSKEHGDWNAAAEDDAKKSRGSAADDEMDEFTPVNLPAPPAKEDEDGEDDDEDDPKTRVAPPKRTDEEDGEDEEGEEDAGEEEGEEDQEEDDGGL